MNAIELVLSIPEIKSEHPRLHSQALGELETIKGQAARIAELEAQVKSLTQTLDLIMEVHPTKNKDNDPFMVRQLVQLNRTRALLETK